MDKVIVKVRGFQKDVSGEQNDVELISVGRHYCKNGVNYVLYDEQDQESNEKSSTMLKIAGDSMKLIRRGAVEHEQYFAANKKSTSFYKTRYGKLAMSVMTKKIDICYGSVSGEVAIDYALEINGQFQSDNQLKISICADGTAGTNIN